MGAGDITTGRLDPSTFLPLRAVEFQIVLSLSEGDKHGYAIIQDARDRGEGAAVPGLATLYRALRRLESEGLVERTGGQDLAEERRRTLRLTLLGRRVAQAEARRLSRMIRAARDFELLGEADA